MLGNIPELTLLAKKGHLFDSEIEREIGHLLEFDDSSRKSDDCAINHGRCSWINNPQFMTAQSIERIIPQWRKSGELVILLRLLRMTLGWP